MHTQAESAAYILNLFLHLRPNQPHWPLPKPLCSRRKCDTRVNSRLRVRPSMIADVLAMGDSLRDCPSDHGKKGLRVSAYARAGDVRCSSRRRMNALNCGTTYVILMLSCGTRIWGDCPGALLVDRYSRRHSIFHASGASSFPTFLKVEAFINPTSFSGYFVSILASTSVH